MSGMSHSSRTIDLPIMPVQPISTATTSTRHPFAAPLVARSLFRSIFFACCVPMFSSSGTVIRFSEKSIDAMDKYIVEHIKKRLENEQTMGNSILRAPLVSGGCGLLSSTQISVRVSSDSISMSGRPASSDTSAGYTRYVCSPRPGMSTRTVQSSARCSSSVMLFGCATANDLTPLYRPSVL